jgi:N-acetylneuraminic acid mutarotase
MKYQLLNISVLFLLLYACSKKDTSMPKPPEPKTWKNLTSMPTARNNFGFVECNNLLYAIGGYNADGLNKVEVYDPAGDKWTTKTPMPTARAYLVVATVSNKIYAIGGLTGSNLSNVTYIKATEEYDPASDTWTERSPIPVTAVPFNNVRGNFFMTGAAINGKIYVAVGYTEGDIPTYIYDPATDTWTTGKAISKFSGQPYYSIASNNDLYVINGNSFLQYLPVDDEWRELPLPLMLAFGHVYGTCLAADNANIYSVGGYNFGIDLSTDLNDVETYDPTNASWREDSSLNTARNSAAALVYNGQLYVLGGVVLQSRSSYIPIANFEEFPLK